MNIVAAHVTPDKIWRREAIYGVDNFDEMFKSTAVFFLV
jgi:hypothetical protein